METIVDVIFSLSFHLPSAGTERHHFYIPPYLVWECTCLAPLLFHDLMLVPVPGSTEILPKWASLPDPHTLLRPHCSQWVCPAHTFSYGAPLVASELDLLTYFPLVLPALGSCTLLKPAGTRSPHQGISPAILALGAIRACFSASQRTETIRESVFRLPPPGHSTDSSLTHTPFFSCKRVYLLVLELQPEGQVLGLPHI